MSTSPQSVTERYVSNLIHNGRNKEFDIDSIIKIRMVNDATIVGVYFDVIISRNVDEFKASGATIAQAVRRSLEKHDVTFR